MLSAVAQPPEQQTDEDFEARAKWLLGAKFFDDTDIEVKAAPKSWAFFPRHEKPTGTLITKMVLSLWQKVVDEYLASSKLDNVEQTLYLIASDSNMAVLAKALNIPYQEENLTLWIKIRNHFDKTASNISQQQKNRDRALDAVIRSNTFIDKMLREMYLPDKYQLLSQLYRVEYYQNRKSFLYGLTNSPTSSDPEARRFEILRQVWLTSQTRAITFKEFERLYSTEKQGTAKEMVEGYLERFKLRDKNFEHASVIYGMRDLLSITAEAYLKHSDERRVSLGRRLNIVSNLYDKFIRIFKLDELQKSELAMLASLNAVSSAKVQAVTPATQLRS